MTYIVYHIGMKYFDWDDAKNEWLIKNRGISFELCIEYMEKGYLLDTIANHPPYLHQRVFVVNIDGYVYHIPYVEDEEKIFFKTIYPSRKSTKKYLQ